MRKLIDTALAGIVEWEDPSVLSELWLLLLLLLDGDIIVKHKASILFS